MTFMDRLPTVISCCFCCFLRAGTVMIAIVSFFAGLILAPNVSHSHGFWDMNGGITKGTTTEAALQMILGWVSILLCIASVFLLIGALCNIPKLIEMYQYGALVYAVTMFFLFLILAIFCIFVHGNCALAVGTLVLIMLCNVLCPPHTYGIPNQDYDCVWIFPLNNCVRNCGVTTYFVIVANSLRMSMMYLGAESFVI